MVGIGAIKKLGTSKKIANQVKKFVKTEYQHLNVATPNLAKWESWKGLNHTIKGEFETAIDGTRKLVSGMHTSLGLKHFLKINANAGKRFSFKKVTSFPEKVESGPILIQELDNGVIRLQIPRDAWKDDRVFESALKRVENINLKGIKTLWPDNFINEIPEAAKTALQQKKNGLPGVYKGIRTFVRLENGKVKSCYPNWIQKKD